MSSLDTSISLCYNCPMNTEFTELCEPAENSSGWYVPAGDDTFTNSFLYDDGNIYFAPWAPDTATGYFTTKSAAYLASINYYIKCSHDYPHIIYGVAARAATSQSTIMEFE